MEHLSLTIQEKMLISYALSEHCEVLKDRIRVNQDFGSNDVEFQSEIRNKISSTEDLIKRIMECKYAK